MKISQQPFEIRSPWADAICAVRTTLLYSHYENDLLFPLGTLAARICFWKLAVQLYGAGTERTQLDYNTYLKWYLF